MDSYLILLLTLAYCTASKGTSEQVEIVHHQALTSPVSTGLLKTHQSPKETYSEVP